MAGIEILDTINSPGSPGKTGDDRSGFDSAAGTAWVLDGATDATALKPFPRAESGAAWVAEAVSEALLDAAPAGHQATDYLARVLATVRARAETESEIALERLPPEAWPIASGIWMRRIGELAEYVWAGDCMALDMASGEIIGTLEKAEEESAHNREILKRSEAERWEEVRRQRALAFQAAVPVFGLRPQLAAHFHVQRRPALAGDEMLLFSDGFFRLVEPYGLVDGPGLAELVRREGIGGAISRLRTHEAASDPMTLARIKPADDSCAIWLRFV